MFKHLLKVKSNNLGTFMSNELNKATRSISLWSINQTSNLNKKNSIGFRENFAYRHIGIDEQNEKIMLQTLKLNASTIFF